jgi:hypothetical protein
MHSFLPCAALLSLWCLVKYLKSSDYVLTRQAAHKQDFEVHFGYEVGSDI